MKYIWISLIIIIIIIVSLLIYKRQIYKTIEGLTFKDLSGKKYCDKDNCPVTKKQNSLYKIHVDYKEERDKNHMLANHKSFSFFGNQTKGPKNIFIIRHGEKIKSKLGLDCNGILRSTYIPELISYLNSKGYGINNIITAYDYNSMHQEQTVQITSWLLNIPIFIYGQQTEPEKAINVLFNNKFFEGKNILICWEHNCIQSLIKNIITTGAKIKGLTNYQFKNSIGNSELPYWEDNNYKSIYHFDDNLNFELLEEKFTTCFPHDNNNIIYGKEQKCGKKK
jgi:hypothetical protein